MMQVNLSPEEVQSLKNLANPGLLRSSTLPGRLRAKFAMMGYGEQRLGHFAITERGRRALWELAGKRGR
jgi:hypothetical protein